MYKHNIVIKEIVAGMESSTFPAVWDFCFWMQ